MMMNKWVQAVLLTGIGVGIFIGPALYVILGVYASFAIAWVLVMIGLWLSASARGTDGWGGAYHGPKQSKKERQ